VVVEVGGEKIVMVGVSLTWETRTSDPSEGEIMGKDMVRWMLGVKDTGMMGEGMRLADCREGTMFAVAMVGDAIA
jgi:hypothetical protein